MVIYKKYLQMQRYLNGEPFVPEVFKKGGLANDYFYESEQDCINGLSKKWVFDQYICSIRDKYEQFKKQYSEDDGKTWHDVEPKVTKLGKLVEKRSDDCPTIKWEDTSVGDYMLKDKYANGTVFVKKDDFDNAVAKEEYEIMGIVAVPPSHNRYGKENVGSIWVDMTYQFYYNLSLKSKPKPITFYDNDSGNFYEEAPEDFLYCDQLIYKGFTSIYRRPGGTNSNFGFRTKSDDCTDPSNYTMLVPFDENMKPNRDYPYEMNGMEKTSYNGYLRRGYKYDSNALMYVPTLGELVYPSLFEPYFDYFLKQAKYTNLLTSELILPNGVGHVEWTFSWHIGPCHSLSTGVTSDPDPDLTIDDNVQVPWFVQYDGTNFIDSISVENEWRYEGETICQVDDLYQVLVEYIFDSNTLKWSATGNTKIGDLVEASSTACMGYDVALMDKSTNKVVIVDKDELKNGQYTSDNYEPLGVVVNSFENNVYGDGSCGIAGLVTLNMFGSPYYVESWNGDANYGSNWYTDPGDLTSTVDGRLNTNKLIDNSLNNNVTSWKTMTGSMASFGTKRYHYPAAFCAWRCTYGGTHEGDWYLSAIDEIAKVFNNRKLFNNTLKAIGTVFGETSFITDFNNNSGINFPDYLGSVTKREGNNLLTYYKVSDGTEVDKLTGDTTYQWIPFMRVMPDGTVVR